VIAELLLALHLAKLTGPDGGLIEVNPEEVVSIRAPGTIEGHFPGGTRCVVNTSDGKFLPVREKCEEVAKALEIEEWFVHPGSRK
jgi:hypothetical protein